VTSTIDGSGATPATSPAAGSPAAPEPDPRFVGPVYTGPVYAPPSKVSLFILRAYERTPRWAAPAAIAACFLGVASYVWVSNPTAAGAADPPTCLVKLTTGLDCPGCGGTRAFYFLMHGNLPEAVRHHAIAVFAAPFLVWLYVAWAVNHVWGRSVPMPRFSAKTVSLFLGAWAVFMVVRNIPIAPFTYLFV
jgi:hypothetical protein